jgi:hypothetical protein
MHVGDLPADTLMFATFKKNRSCFDDIIQTARSESNLSKIATGFVQLNDDPNPSTTKRRKFLPDERWNRYKTLFVCAGIDGVPGGIRLGSNSFYLQAATWGLGGSGGEKGYVWSQSPVGPLVDSLDTLSPAQRSSSPGMFYRHIEGPWYLMIDWD